MSNGARAATVTLLACGTVSRSGGGPSRLAMTVRRWRLPIFVGLVAIVGMVAYSMLEPHLVFGAKGWVESQHNDLWAGWRSAALLTYRGGYAHVYSYNIELETAPGWELFIAPIARSLSHCLSLIRLRTHIPRRGGWSARSP